LLREREELTMEEIGMILEVPSGTVKSRLNRARKRARKLYKEAIR
jgi:DNA-directed RNA polymerase specialized sigma24 family protein